jgi:hypothetical protein
MALQKSNATIAAFKLEDTFKEQVTFEDVDVVPYSSLSWKPETDKIERSYLNSKSLIAGKPLQGKSTAGGSINMEVLPDATDSTKLVGDVLYQTAIGEYAANGAKIDLDNHTIVDHRGDDDGDAGLYYLSDGSAIGKSLGAKYVIGGIEANSVDIRGVLVSSLKFTFPTQGLVTADFSLTGSTGFIPVDQGSDLVDFCSSMTPHVARGMTVTIDGTDICATDLEFTITNEVADYVCITQTGVGEKSVTKRAIEGSFKIAFENLDQVNAYNSWGEASIFAYAVNIDGKELAVELPKTQRTSLDLGDDNGIFTQTVTFTVIDDCSSTGLPIKIAVK